MFCYDLHIHTAETSRCGSIGAREMVKLYRKSGYSGLVVTDHYHEEFFHLRGNISWEEKIDAFLAGYRAALAVASDCGFEIFLGMELSFAGSRNDYLVYGVTEEFLLKNPELYNLDLATFRELTKDLGMLIFQAHPFRKRMEYPQPEYLDGIEIFNGNKRHDSRNYMSEEFALENNLIGISGSDFHEYEDLAGGGILLPEKVSDYQEFLAALINSDFEICSQAALV